MGMMVSVEGHMVTLVMDALDASHLLSLLEREARESARRAVFDREFRAEGGDFCEALHAWGDVLVLSEELAGVNVPHTRVSEWGRASYDEAKHMVGRLNAIIAAQDEAEEGADLG